MVKMMLVVKKIVTALICMLPSILAVQLLRLIGHSVGRKVKIGLSIVYADIIYLQDFSRIGHLNFICCDGLDIAESAYIGRGNIIYGSFWVILHKLAAIGNNNKIIRGPKNTVSATKSSINLGELSKVTTNHRIDMSRSVKFGKYTTLAGAKSEIWTHGYFHDREGPGRYRIDGEVILGDNIYIGSSSIIVAGVKIASGAHVGPGASITKNITSEGIYLSPMPIKISSEVLSSDHLTRDETIKSEIVLFTP